MLAEWNMAVNLTEATGGPVGGSQPEIFLNLVKLSDWKHWFLENESTENFVFLLE